MYKFDLWLQSFETSTLFLIRISYQNERYSFMTTDLLKTAGHYLARSLSNKYCIVYPLLRSLSENQVYRLSLMDNVVDQSMFQI